MLAKEEHVIAASAPCMGTNRVSRTGSFQGSSPAAESKLGMGWPGPVSMIVPPWTAWLSTAVEGR
jgi:hypothetical protein